MPDSVFSLVMFFDGHYSFRHFLSYISRELMSMVPNSGDFLIHRYVICYVASTVSLFLGLDDLHFCRMFHSLFNIFVWNQRVNAALSFIVM